MLRGGTDPALGRQEYVMRSAASLLLLLFLAPSFAAQQGDPTDDSDIQVTVTIVGERVGITSSLYVEATPSEAWAVMTDYDHAAEFIPDLELSRIVAYEDDAIQVEQKGTARLGPFSFRVESVRRIELFPFTRIESVMIRGTMKEFRGTSLLNAEGAGTRITNNADFIPDFWLPPIIGPAFVEHETRERLGELRREILKRRKAALGQ